MITIKQSSKYIKKIVNKEIGRKGIERFKNAFYLQQNLKSDFFLSPISLDENKNELIMRFEPFDSFMLADINFISSLTIEDKLDIAIKAANALAFLHHNKIIYNEVCPKAFLYDKKSGILKFSGLERAVKFGDEQAEWDYSRLEIERACCIAPEQSGRVDDNIDFRSDLYSLGITFYFIFSNGIFPFQNSDVMSLIHAHIAQTPSLLNNIVESSSCKLVESGEIFFPVMISKIVEKLLQKNKTERYQSCEGVLADLKQCRHAVITAGNIPEFEIGRYDYTAHLALSKDFFGREKEREKLLELFSSLKEHGGQELVFIAGYAGVGKSGLVNVFKEKAEKQGAFFIKGKFEQYKTSVPYYGFMQAIEHIAEQILFKNDKYIQLIKKRLLESVGTNIAIICEFVPKLSLIVGELPSLPVLPLTETKNRFNLTFLTFVKTICSLGQEIVLFLDDLQWADAAALNLLKNIIEDSQIRHLMMILVYRDNEINRAHPLSLMMKELSSFNRIDLKPLTLENLNSLIASTLNSSFEITLPLTRAVMTKTRGNPFFTREFLKNLHRQKLLAFDYSQGKWIWDIEEIKSQNISDNVVDLVLDRLNHLPWDCARLLCIASCIGNIFGDIEFSGIFNEPKATLHDRLYPAVEAELIIPVSPRESRELSCYSFSHDRIQQASSMLMTNEEIADIHLSIGRWYENKAESDQSSITLEYNFKIVDHFNRAIDFIDDEAARIKLASDNYKAAVQAKLSTAYDIAISYLEKTLYLISKNSSVRDNAADVRIENYIQNTIDYNKFICSNPLLYIESLIELAELKYLTFDFAGGDSIYAKAMDNITLLGEILPKEPSLGEILPEEPSCGTKLLQSRLLPLKIKLYQIVIHSWIALNKMEDALLKGVDVLEELGIELPAEDNPLVYYPALEKLYDKSKISFLLDLPVMKDEISILALDILNAVMSPAYLVSPKYYPKICYAAVKLCIENGNCAASANVYAFHSLFLCGMMSRYKEGSDFAKLAQTIALKFDAKAYIARVDMIANACVAHWNASVECTLLPLKKAASKGLEYGDVEHACYSAMYYCLYSFMRGNPLDEVKKECSYYFDFTNELRQKFQTVYIDIWQQCIHNIMIVSDDPMLFYADAVKEKELLDTLIDANNVSSLYSFFLIKAILATFFNFPELGLEMIQEAGNYKMGVASLYHEREYHIYESVIFYLNLDSIDNQIVFDLLENNYQYFERLSHTAYENNICCMYLVEALMKGVNDDPDTWDSLKRAMTAAQEFGFIHIAIIAFELGVRYWHSRGQKEFAAIYARKAVSALQAWGATAVGYSFVTRYPDCLTLENQDVQNIENTNSLDILKSSRETLKNVPRSLENVSHAIASVSQSFDLASVLKASHAIAEERRLENLLGKIMDIINQNSGSQRGILLLKKGDELVVEAEGIIGENTILKPKAAGIKENCNDEADSKSYNIALDADSKNLCDMKKRDAESYPESVVNYVQHTLLPLMLNMPSEQKEFSRDPYISSVKPQSLLSLPIVYKGELIGILYLENRNIQNVYSNERIEILKFLSNQAAISIVHARLYQQVVDHASLLEKRVQERTAELNHSNETLKKTLDDLHTAQAHLVQQEKMAALGQLIAGVAHEINTPLGAINTSAGNLTRAVSEILGRLPIIYNMLSKNEEKLFNELISEIDKIDKKSRFLTTREERQIIRKISKELDDAGIDQSREMGSMLVQLKVYDDPLRFKALLNHKEKNFIFNMAYNIAAIISNSSNIHTAVKRASKMVFALKSYAHFDRHGIKIEADIKDGLESVLTIYHNQIKQGIELIRNYGTLPKILCYPDELNQVWNNLIHNALQAMEYKGSLTVGVETAQKGVLVTIQDTGCGIPAEIQHRIFEPFFTTKQAGEGSGLGLDIVKRIVEKHGGTIEIESVEHKGTLCRVIIPDS